MLRRLLISTLFPYTTLFRSERLAGALVLFLNFRQLRVANQTALSHQFGENRGFVFVHGLAPLHALLFLHLRQNRLRVLRLGDRKSTRLNSSHRCISYAVFCLNATSPPHFYTLSLHDALPI